MTRLASYTCTSVRSQAKMYDVHASSKLDCLNDFPGAALQQVEENDSFHGEVEGGEIVEDSIPVVLVPSVH